MAAQLPLLEGAQQRLGTVHSHLGGTWHVHHALDVLLYLQPRTLHLCGESLAPCERRDGDLCVWRVRVGYFTLS